MPIRSKLPDIDAVSADNLPVQSPGHHAVGKKGLQKFRKQCQYGKLHGQNQSVINPSGSSAVITPVSRFTSLTNTAFIGISTSCLPWGVLSVTTRISSAPVGKICATFPSSPSLVSTTVNPIRSCQYQVSSSRSGRLFLSTRISFPTRASEASRVVTPSRVKSTPFLYLPVRFITYSRPGSRGS